MSPERAAELRAMGCEAFQAGLPLNSWPLSLRLDEVLLWWEGWRACSAAARLGLRGGSC